MAKYTIGVDFGTLSGRAVLVDVADGREVATAVYNYSNGVIDNVLPNRKTTLGPDWALQDPADYLRVFEVTIPAVLRESGICPDDVIGIGIDFTACTMLPTDAEGRPLCWQERYASNPHAWVKLWKHHAAQPEANLINKTAEEMGESFLSRYGGRISSEWFFAKALQILTEDPDLYADAARMMEAADWVILQLTGNERRNACTAGYKAIWSKQEGYPRKEYLQALHPGFANIVEDKLSLDIYPAGTNAGNLLPSWAKALGLPESVAVAVANVDAHVAVPASTVVEAGKMVMVMGTSICHMVLGTTQEIVPGMCGVVEDGILPGFFGYEAGQSAVGDIFGWFVDTCVPESYIKEAEAMGVDIHTYLENEAASLLAGQSGLVALDWWNGNRSILVDADLTGLIIGLTLHTKPEEIYRALIEATAYGTATIIKAFESNGVFINELYACGGLPERNSLLMQIYADVTDKPIRIAASPQTPALGSAMFAAVAAGSSAGGYDSIVDAAEMMAAVKDEVFEPIHRNVEVYRRLFAIYTELHDLFGRTNPLMKTLKALKAEVMGK